MRLTCSLILMINGASACSGGFAPKAETASTASTTGTDGDETQTTTREDPRPLSRSAMAPTSSSSTCGAGIARVFAGDPDGLQLSDAFEGGWHPDDELGPASDLDDLDDLDDL